MWFYGLLEMIHVPFVINIFNHQTGDVVTPSPLFHQRGGRKIAGNFLKEIFQMET